MGEGVGVGVWVRGRRVCVRGRRKEGVGEREERKERKERKERRRSIRLMGSLVSV